MAVNPLALGPASSTKANDFDTRDLARTVDCPWRKQPPTPTPILLQSLRLRTDSRYQEIEHYTKSDEHFKRLLEKAGGTAQTLQTIKLDDLDTPAEPKAEIRDRVYWEKAFDKSVKSLLIDFDLSDEPNYRLEHLDRMHKWFETHGQKQSRKAKQAPNYLVVEKNAVVPAGSTQNVSGNLSDTSLILAASMTMRRSKNIPSLKQMTPGAYSNMPKTAR